MYKNFGKDDEEFQIMQDWWKIWKQFAVPEKDEQYWNEFAKAGDEFLRKHGNNQFNRDLFLSLYEGQERLLKEMENKK